MCDGHVYAWCMCAQLAQVEYDGKDERFLDSVMQVLEANKIKVCAALCALTCTGVVMHVSRQELSHVGKVKASEVAVPQG